MGLVGKRDCESEQILWIQEAVWGQANPSAMLRASYLSSEVRVRVSQNCSHSLVGFGGTRPHQALMHLTTSPLSESPVLHLDSVLKASGLMRGSWGQWLCFVWYQPCREGVGLEKGV